jgi:hypothetical protein
MNTTGTTHNYFGQTIDVVTIGGVTRISSPTSDGTDIVIELPTTASPEDVMSALDCAVDYLIAVGMAA